MVKRLSIEFKTFKKAREIYYSGEVFLTAVSDTKAYFDVGDKKIIVEKAKTPKGQAYARISCSCKSCSYYHLKKGAWCAYSLAAVFYIEHKKGQLKM